MQILLNANNLRENCCCALQRLIFEGLGMQFHFRVNEIGLEMYDFSFVGSNSIGSFCIIYAAHICLNIYFYIKFSSMNQQM